MAGKETQGRPINAKKQGRIPELGQKKTEEGQRGRIRPVKVLKADDGWPSLGQGDKNFMDCFLKTGFPKLRTHPFDLRVAEAVKTPNVWEDFLFLSAD
jgi:hypothetical protein